MTQPFSSMFDSLFASLDQAQNLRPDPAALENAPEVVGTAFDERISVRMKAGRVLGVEIQPPARRLDAEELSDHLTEAINKAIDANLEAMTSGADAEVPDLQALNAQLQDVQRESISQLEKYTSGMEEMLRNAKNLGQNVGTGVRDE